MSFLVCICASSRLPIKSVHIAPGDLGLPCLRPADHVEADSRDVMQHERISVLEIRQQHFSDEITKEVFLYDLPEVAMLSISKCFIFQFKTSVMNQKVIKCKKLH